MVEIMTREAEACDLKELVAKFIPESIGREIEKACQARCCRICRLVAGCRLLHGNASFRC